MDIYESEKEQIEALKKWWKENGRPILIGLALGLGGVFGWTSWQSYQNARAEQASSQYTLVVNLARNNQLAQVRQVGEELIREHARSGYAALTARIIANAAYLQQELEEAKRHLNWAMENARRKELKLMARLRLARLLLGEEDHEGALALLEGVDAGNFRASYEEIRGDVFLAQGKRDAARSAYAVALANGIAIGENRARIQMKLDDLGTPAKPQEATEESNQP